MEWDELRDRQARVKARVEKSANQARVEQILEQSDIVWSRYGSETIEQLAERIVKAL